jgi:hypothetical protein
MEQWDAAKLRGDVLAELNGAPSDALVLAQLLSDRYSCRAYLPRSVPRATIEPLPHRSSAP